MSEFQITEDNISRFSKRLKKTIQKNLGTDITLSQATLLIAEMLGNNSIHQMQENLSKEAEKTQRIADFLDKRKKEVIMLPNPRNLEVITLMDGFEKRYVQYAVVSADFLERKALPYYLNDFHFSTVALYGETAQFYDKLSDAMENCIDKQRIILEYATPAYSHMENQLPICSKYYIASGDGKFSHHSINDNY